MVGFWGRYLTTAVVGTALLELGLPGLKRLLVAETRAPAPADRVAPTLQAAPPARHRQLLGPPSSGHAVIKDGEHGAASEPGAIAAPSATGVLANGSITAAEMPAAGLLQTATETQVVTVIDFTHLVPTSGSDVTHWGVTLREAPYFERDGRRRREELAGGTLVEQIGITSSSRGEMALCRIARGRSWAGPYLIPTADLQRYEGTRERVDAARLRALQQFCALNARIETRKRELLKAAVDANPHGSELRRAQSAYKEAEVRSRELTAFRDRAIGAERNRLADELRRLQVETATLRQRVETLNRRYKEWKDKHGVPAAIDPARDAHILGWEAEMAALHPQLEGMDI